MSSFAHPGAIPKVRLQTVCLFRFAIANRRGDGAIIGEPRPAKAAARRRACNGKGPGGGLSRCRFRRPARVRRAPRADSRRYGARLLRSRLTALRERRAHTRINPARARGGARCAPANRFNRRPLYASAFFGTSLAATLTSLQADTTIITGVTTSGCVRATTLDAMQYGFIPYVVRDAVGDRDSRPHEANLFDLAAKYAEVVSESDIVGLIGSRAGWRSRTNQSSTSRDTSPARRDTSNARRETSNR